MTFANLVRYQQPAALERLLILIAVLLHHPGIGGNQADDSKATAKHHQALKAVQQKWQAMATTFGIEFKADYPAIPTLRKDLEALRDVGILERRMYRWGYYLGTGVLTLEELPIALNALESQAIYQGDPRARLIYEQIRKRLRGFGGTDTTDFFYPVRQHLNRAINYTDPQEMMEKGHYRHTLYHQIDAIEQAIVQGQPLELSRVFDPYQGTRLGLFQVYPLQLAYYDIAWYLLAEDVETGGLSFSRMNRLGNYCQPLPLPCRSLETQTKRLNQAYRLLANGWGLNLGTVEEQKQELAGDLNFVTAKVRFYPPTSQFIVEGERRHSRQKVKAGKVDPVTGRPAYVDYQVILPPRSLDEFSIWVQRYADKAQVLSPAALVDQHRQMAIAHVQRYQIPKDNI